MRTDKIALEYLILEVLEKELYNGDEFLTDSEIAYKANGISYEKGYGRYAPIVSKSVRDRMPRVREIADEKGMTIIAKRVKDEIKTKKVYNPEKRKQELQVVKNDSKSLKVIGWKIASTKDTQYIKNELEIRVTLRDAFEDSRSKIQETATKKGLLPPPIKDIPQLDE
jgi:hypothetical protein